MGEKRDDRRYVQSVERAMKIMAFIADEGPARLNRISEVSHLKATTAFGLLQTLEHMGYISRSGNGMAYCLGLGALKLGLCYDQNSGMKGKIHALLTEMVKAVDETAYFEIKVGKRYYYYDVVLSTQPLKVVPDYDSFISLPSESAVAKVFASPMDEMPYALDLEEVEPGLNCFAVPYYEGNAKIGCVALSGPSSRFTREKMERAYRIYCDLLENLQIEKHV